MELNIIRKELDKLGQSIDYIILFRLSLAILVRKVKEADIKTIHQELNTSKQILSDFIMHMDSVKEILHENGIAGDKFLVSLSEYYKNLFTYYKNKTRTDLTQSYKSQKGMIKA